MDWINTKAVWNGEDWIFTDVPLEASPNWGGRTCFSPMELNYTGGDPDVALAALKYWVAVSWGNGMSMDDLREVQLWYAVGLGGVYYGSKGQCEAAVRKAYPDEDPDTRYGRVFYKTFYEEVL